MGYLNAGLFGEVRNKIGGVIFSNWKGINTAREYKIPANPQSVAQTAQRTKFAVVVALAQSLLGTLIVTFWNPFAVKMSGFNAFIKSVFPNVTSTGLVTANCKVTSGTLESVALSSAGYAPGTGVLTVDYSNAISGNGLATDNVSCLVLDSTDNSVIGYFANEDTRTTASFDVTLATGLTADDLICYIWASRGSGSTFIVSDSTAIACAEL